jgi:glycosyltransferase involved in cell wall biosynthesis
MTTVPTYKPPLCTPRLNARIEPMPEAACLTAVIPCYNEQATIIQVIKRVLDEPSVGEVVVVDDGSTDNTRDLLAGIDEPRVRVILQPYNMGKGAALRTGITLATQKFVIIQDADLEYDPADYDALLIPLRSGQADVVYGSRFLGGQSRRVLYFRHSMGNRLLTLTSNLFTDLNLTDMETCYKVFRRELIQSITIEENRFGFEPEITAKVARAKWRVYEVGVNYHGRTYADGKKIGWKDGVWAFACIARYSGIGVKVRQRIGRG